MRRQSNIKLRLYCSHRESNKWTALCCRLPSPIGQDKAQVRHSCCPGHDHIDNHALFAARSRSTGLQHVPRRPRRGHLFCHWWFERTNSWIARSYWIAIAESGTVFARWHHTAERMSSVRPAWNRQNTAGPCRCITIGCKLPESCIQRDCRQVHRRECTFNSWNVQLCPWPSAVHHIHGWNWRHRWVTHGSHGLAD